jgi:hypothetical protein
VAAAPADSHVLLPCHKYKRCADVVNEARAGQAAYLTASLARTSTAATRIAHLLPELTS